MTSPLAGDSAVSAIAPDGEKMLGLQFLKHDIEMVHAASYDCDARLELMDRMGVSHGIVYPNVGGFGNQNFLKVEDTALRIACVEIYNDWMSDLQQRSGGRILPDGARAVVGHRRLRGRGRPHARATAPRAS